MAGAGDGPTKVGAELGPASSSRVLGHGHPRIRRRGRRLFFFSPSNKRFALFSGTFFYAFKFALGRLQIYGCPVDTFGKLYTEAQQENRIDGDQEL